MRVFSVRRVWALGRGRTPLAWLVAGVMLAAIAGCDPGPGGLIYRDLVQNECGVPIRADVSDYKEVRRILIVAEQPLIAPGETADLGSSFIQVERIYVSVSRDGAATTEDFYPFVMAELTAVPTERSHEVAYTYVVEGDLCPAP